MAGINIIVAFAANGLGIACDGHLPWHIPADLERFKSLTMGNMVIMGRKTYDSLPAACRPLPGRQTIVVTCTPAKSVSTQPGVTYVDMEGAIELALYTVSVGSSVWVAGGEEIYRAFMPLADAVYATLVWPKQPPAKPYDKVFPAMSNDGVAFGDAFQIADASPRQWCDTGLCHYQYVTYTRRPDGSPPTAEYAYLGLLTELMQAPLRTDRTGTGTHSMFARQVRVDLSGGELPMLTTKAVPWRAVMAELLWFLRGCTDAKQLSAQGVHIWDGNTSRQFLDNRGLPHYKEGDIGPMYGFVWRHVGAEYKGAAADHMNTGFDQLAQVERLLREDPFSRRIIMTTYHVPYLEQGCLHPCHGLVAQFYVEEDTDGTRWLSCHMYQRSQDTFLAWSFNATGYSVLTHLLAARNGMKAKELVISYGDVHLYADHYDAAVEQLARPPLPPPLLRLSPNVAKKAWEELSMEDFELAGYAHQPRIAARMSV